jgi:hypothetical protein
MKWAVVRARRNGWRREGGEEKAGGRRELKCDKRSCDIIVKSAGSKM